MLLRRRFTVENRFDVPLNVPPELGVVDRFGSVPKVVSIAITSDWIELGCDASIISTTLTLSKNPAIDVGYDAAMVVLSKTTPTVE
jgi:hypothetical protein